MTISFLLIIVISVLTGVFFEPPPPLTKKQLLRSVDSNASADGSVAQRNRVVAVGTNICIDLIVPAKAFFEANSAFPTHSATDGDEESLPDSAIESEQDLVDTFAHFFSRAAAAERFVDAKLFGQLVASAAGLESTRKRLGGNAALIGDRLAKLGHSVLVSGSGGDDLQSLVSEGVSFSGAGAGPAEVETHIILEYGVDDVFQGLTTNRANRLILTPSTVPSTDTLEAWSAAAAELQSGAGPDAVVFSGLHLFESATADAWRPYLAAASNALQRSSQTGPKHLELASLSNEALTKDIVATLFPTVTSIGLNEEELGALFFALGGSYDDLPTRVCDPKRDAEAKRHRILRWKIVKRVIKLLQLDEYLEEVDPPEIPPCLLGKAPDVSAVSAALDYVFRAARAQGSTVTRIHFHSLGYHIVATARDAPWNNAVGAAASGSVTATYQACNVTSHADLHGDDLQLVVSTKLDVDGTGEDIRKLTKSTAVHEWDTEALHHTFAPVLVCKSPDVTVGLGDAISASALAAHLH